MSLWPDTAAKMLNEQYDVYEKAREEYRKKIAEQALEIERLRAALLAFADHFGPLEDNELLHEDARKCFALARAALGGKDD